MYAIIRIINTKGFTMKKVVYIKEDLHHRIKIQATLLKMDIQDFVAAHMLNAVQNAEQARNKNDIPDIQ